MKSMTGYGVAQFQSDELALEITLKSVNGRYFDPRMHLPREYFPYEADVKKLLHGSVRRGTVDLYVQRRPGSRSSGKKLHLQLDLARMWLKAHRELARETGVSGELTLAELASLPEVMRLEDKSGVAKRERHTLLECVAKALEQLEKERVREGRALKKLLLAHLNELQKVVQKVGSFREQAHVFLRQKVENRLQRLGMESSLDPHRLAQEVVILLDKTDIDEEICRLTEHIKSCKNLLQKGEAPGKKLDFFCQELLRETNTLGAKSQLTEITHLVVEAKAIIERFREQVQNLE